MAVATGARLSTTSEGLWLTAALCGISRLPRALKVRPTDGIEGADLSSHPGIAVLQEAGVYSNGTVDADVAQWVMTLGRPDIEVTVEVNVPAAPSDRLLGPPPVFTTTADLAAISKGGDAAIEAYAQLLEWRKQQPPQRIATLCCRDGSWVSAARVWSSAVEPSAESDDQSTGELDEVVVTPLGRKPVGTSILELLGSTGPAEFRGLSVNSRVLDSIVSQWQHDPDGNNLVAQLVDELEISAEQARIIEAVGDQSAARATIGACEYHFDGPRTAQKAMLVADTIYGRVLVSGDTGFDDQEWTMLTPGTEARIQSALDEVLSSLPCGSKWSHYRRHS
ncbi:ESX secretion-associated protein EspG [Mycobacteroides abscessus subsp. abscessus]|nr:ESX secretion-associated protein EspG [Mycobacteroides abscessus subsp. abscessus]